MTASTDPLVIPYVVARMHAEQVAASGDGSSGALTVAALLAELDVRAERIAAGAVERVELIRELTVVYGERDSALDRLDPGPRQNRV